MFSFFTQTAPEGVAIATDISSYLDFALALSWLSVCALKYRCHYFALLDRCHNHESIGGQTPLYYCGSILCWHDLNATRRVLLKLTSAVPMCLLFELGLLVARFYQPKEDEEEASAGRKSG